VSVIACRQLLAAAQDGQRNGATLPYSEASAMMAANARRTAIHKLTNAVQGATRKIRSLRLTPCGNVRVCP
jgi:hypothetical protein